MHSWLFTQSGKKMLMCNHKKSAASQGVSLKIPTRSVAEGWTFLFLCTQLPAIHWKNLLALYDVMKKGNISHRRDVLLTFPGIDSGVPADWSNKLNAPSPRTLPLRLYYVLWVVTFKK